MKNDVSVPISRVPEFISRATVACERLIPGIRAVPFGFDSVAITVKSATQQAADLQARVSALQAARVLNAGQADKLIKDLTLKGNNGHVGKVQQFLAAVAGLRTAGILTQAQADALTGPGNVLLLSVTRR